jgi:tetratricopeptide (TPR) repeat protein
MKVAELNVDYYKGNLLEIKNKSKELLAELQAKKLDWWECIFLIIIGQAAYERGDINYCWGVSQIVLDMDNPVIDEVWQKLFSNYLRGGLYCQLGNYEKAEEYFLKNIELKADDFMALITKLGLVKVNIVLQKYQKCALDLEEIIERASGHGFEAIVEGAMLEQLNLELAQRKKKRLSKKFFDIANFLEKSEYVDIRIMLLEILGRAYAWIGENEPSFEYFEKAFAEATKHQYFWVRLSAIKGLLAFNDSYQPILREMKRKLEKEELASEASELAESLEAWRLGF